MNHLRQIAARATPLSEIDYIEMQIEAEKSRRECGWAARVHFLAELLVQAKITQAIAEGNESSFMLPTSVQPTPKSTPPQAMVRRSARRRG